MVDLIHLFSQYELLELAAQSLSTLDLYHTALTCSTLYTLIRTPDAKFQRLKRVNTCDGKGLAARQESPKVWATIHALVNSLSIPKAEIKVRIFEDCNGRGALPCIKCGINVCEDCRVFPREKHEWGPRRPHCNDQAQMFNIVCFCEACDEEVAAKIPGEDYCQCDIYTRWICRKCKWEEGKEEVWYRKHWTQMYCGGEPEVAGAGTTLPDDQQERMVCDLS